MRQLALARRGSRLAIGLLVAAGGSLGLLAAPASAVPTTFDTPSALAVVGTHLFIANEGNSTVTEVKAADGSYIRTIPASTLKVEDPEAMVADNDSLFVVGTSGSVTELSSSGRFLGQAAIAGCGGGATLAAASASEIVELCFNGRINEISTSGPVRTSTIKPSVIKASEATFTSATALAVEGTTAYVTFETMGHISDGVIALSLSTHLVTDEANNVADPGDGFAAPAGIAAVGKDVWVTNAGVTSSGTVVFNPSIVELNRSDLSFVASDNSTADIGQTGAILAHHSPGANDTDVYVATVNNPSISTPMVSYYDSTLSTPLEWEWMMCNTNNSPTTSSRYPYKYNHPSAFALYGSTLWVANEGTDTGLTYPTPNNNPTHVEAMDAESGAFLFNAK